MRVRLTSLQIPVPRLATDEDRASVGFMLVQQVKERFRTQGMSGDFAWAPKRRTDGRAVLTGRSATLLNSWQWALTGKKGVECFSTAPYAKVHQLGTVGKGGSLPTIVPKRAKALFIPLTDRAASSERLQGAPALRYRRMLGVTESMKPIRVATRGPKTGLIYGVDFVFAKRVDIPPRPMLPDSVREQDAQARFFEV